MKNKKIKGFTLIELLVVISVIGLLSTFAVIALDNARKKARDARRISDIGQIQKALDLYYDQHDGFPISGNCASTIPNSGWCNSIQSLSGGYWIRDGSSTNLGEFLPKDPLDPKPAASAIFSPISGGSYFYYSRGYGEAGQWYMIVFGLEDYTNPLQNEDGVTACDGTYFHYGNGSNGIITLGRNCQQ